MVTRHLAFKFIQTPKKNVIVHLVISNKLKNQNMNPKCLKIKAKDHSTIKCVTMDPFFLKWKDFLAKNLLYLHVYFFNNLCILVISREIRPLAALYPLPSIQKMVYSAAISSFALDLRSQWSPGAVCSCLWHLRPFLLYQFKNYMWGGRWGIALPGVWFQGTLPAFFTSKDAFFINWKVNCTSFLFHFLTLIKVKKVLSLIT